MSERVWSRDTLGRLAYIEMGQAPSSVYVSDRETSNASPFLQGNADFTQTSPLARMWCSRPTKMAKTGDALISVRAPVGALNRADRNYAIGRGLAAIRFHGIDPGFGYYQLDLNRALLQRVAQGSTFDAIGSSELKALEFLVPPPREQRKITEVLDTIDDQIWASERIVAKLDLLEGGLLAALMRGGLRADGSPRDPDGCSDEFLATEVGRVPKGWSVCSLSSIASVERGKFGHRPRNDPAYLGGVHPFIQTGDVSAARGGVVDEYSQSLSDRGASVSREFPAGTIAVTIAANIADTAILGRAMYFPDSVVGVEVFPPNDIRFVELALRRAKPSLEARAPQSAQRNINLQDLRPLLIALPKPDEQRRISNVYEALGGRRRRELENIAKLRLQKQGLMTDLLTGRVRVPVEASA